MYESFTEINHHIQQTDSCLWHLKLLEETAVDIDKLELLIENKTSCKFVSFLSLTSGNQNIFACLIPHMVIRWL